MKTMTEKHTSPLFMLILVFSFAVVGCYYIGLMGVWTDSLRQTYLSLGFGGLLCSLWVLILHYGDRRRKVN